MIQNQTQVSMTNIISCDELERANSLIFKQLLIQILNSSSFDGIRSTLIEMINNIIIRMH